MTHAVIIVAWRDTGKSTGRPRGPLVRNLPASLLAQYDGKHAKRNIARWAGDLLTLFNAHLTLCMRSPVFWAARRDWWRRWCGSAPGRPCGPLSPPSFASTLRTPRRSAARPEPRTHPQWTFKKKGGRCCGVRFYHSQSQHLGVMSSVVFISCVCQGVLFSKMYIKILIKMYKINYLTVVYFHLIEWWFNFTYFKLFSFNYEPGHVDPPCLVVSCVHYFNLRVYLREYLPN